MIVPIFGCDDVEKAARFYIDWLGFIQLADFRLQEDKPNPGYRTIALNGHHLHLTSFPTAQGTGKAAYFYMDDVADVAAVYHKLKDHPDITVRVPLVDQTWGLREFSFTDGFGNTLHFGAETNPE